MCSQSTSNNFPKQYPQPHTNFLCLRYFPIENSAIKMHFNTPISTILSSAIFTIVVATFYPSILLCTVWEQCKGIVWGYICGTYPLVEPQHNTEPFCQLFACSGLEDKDASIQQNVTPIKKYARLIAL